MSFFKNLFRDSKSLKECPRCLGKGHVDSDDIKRLKQELRWRPGVCAYCNGSGKIDGSIEANVPVDAAYLYINLDEQERKEIINGNPEAIERGKKHEDAVTLFITQIRFLYDAHLTSLQIAEFFLLDYDDPETYENHKKEFIEYIEKVIRNADRK